MEKKNRYKPTLSQSEEKANIHQIGNIHQTMGCIPLSPPHLTSYYFYCTLPLLYTSDVENWVNDSVWARKVKEERDKSRNDSYKGSNSKILA